MTLFLNILLRLLSYVPLKLLYGLGGAGGQLIFRFDKTYAQRLINNANLAGHNDAHFYHTVARHMGYGAIELAKLWTPAIERYLPKVQVFGWDEVLRHQQGQRGIVLLTPHLGSFEMLSLWLGRQQPLVAMYSPPNVAALEPIMLAGRQQSGVQMASADTKGLRLLLRHLKAGGMTGILPDQVPHPGMDGVGIRVFGRPARTMTLPYKLLKTTGAQLVMARCVRVGAPHYFALHFQVIDFVCTDDPQADTQRINQLLETTIQQMPSQYLWGYNRYKYAPKEV